MPQPGTFVYLGEMLLRLGRNRLLSLAILSAMAAAAAPNAASAAPTKAKLTVALTAPAVPVGQVGVLTGKVKPAAKRSVSLEVKRGKAWKKIATTTSAKRTGAFRLVLPTTTAGTIVVRAKAPKKGAAKALVSLPKTFKVTAVVTPPCCKTNPATPTPAATPTPKPTPSPTATPTPSPTPAPGVINTPPSAKSSFRAIYVLASDQEADPGKYAAIGPSVNATNDWFAGQTAGGVRPRWVRDGSGAVVISTVQLPRPAAAYATATFASVVAELQVAAPTPAGQKTVVWFDVESPNGCGVTGSGVSVLFEAACDIHPTANDVFPFGATYLTAHEMTHNFGAVPACAPHSGGGGHVNDDPKDVLYSGPLDRVWASITLDPGHDDYYATGKPACPGIEGSPYWTTTGDPLS